MSQEDDLRGLAKVIDFMRAISILFVLIHCYWFCYESFREWNITIGVVDRILMNFQKNTGLFSSLLWTKLFAVLFLGLSCLGTRGVKDEKITWRNIIILLVVGFITFFLNWMLLAIPKVGAILYMSSLTIGYICLLMGGTWMSRLLKIILWMMFSMSRMKVSCRKQD